jgi:hypothetical protein
MDPLSWRNEMTKARDSGAVLQVVGLFLDSLDASESQALPQELSSAPPKTAADVSYWAVVLTRAWLDSGAGSGDSILTLGRVSLVFADASRRLAQFGRQSEAHWWP